MIDSSLTKGQIIAALMDQAEDAGNPLSFTKACKLAVRIKRGEYDPELAKVIGWADPTGETACRRVRADNGLGRRRDPARQAGESQRRAQQAWRHTRSFSEIIPRGM